MPKSIKCRETTRGNDVGLFLPHRDVTARVEIGNMAEVGDVL